MVVLVFFNFRYPASAPKVRWRARAGAPTALDFRRLIASNLLKPVLISLLNCIAGESRLGGVFDDVYYFLAERSAVTADQARGFSMLVFPLGLPLCFPQLLSPHAMRLPHETVETAVKLLDDVSLTHRHPAHRRRMTSR